MIGINGAVWQRAGRSTEGGECSQSSGGLQHLSSICHV
jgi:hypothetical protein